MASGENVSLSLAAQPDAVLASRVATGDAGSLEELYNRYGVQVFSMAYGILRDYALAEDLAQEVFMALWTRAGRFDAAKGVFRHWFLHLAHNRVIDEVRRRRRATLMDADRAPEDATLGLVSNGDTADEAITAVLVGEAREALRALPEEQRVVIVMAYLEGATQQEIAQRTGTPLGTVKTRLRLGLGKLRQTMNAPATEGA
ncbi:MAG: sigma-70 family RNA polymerase sigma factor [Chloroflexi bacterium]|nr:sigma-70 family RNA polymerase sigma factor [Chloroflexota bacterium]MYB84663.1 sigma-70 family RNA polymerase sigma factor [Chloroflexota bacterium]